MVCWSFSKPLERGRVIHVSQPGEKQPGTATFNTNYYKLKDCKGKDALGKKKKKKTPAKLTEM